MNANAASRVMLFLSYWAFVVAIATIIGAALSDKAAPVDTGLLLLASSTAGIISIASRTAMRSLYKFTWDCGRGGWVRGIFVAEQGEVAAAVGRDVYFGEILGKHSEIYGTLDAGDIVELTGTPEQIDWLVATFDAKPDAFCDVPSASITIFGHNPLQHLQETSE